VSTSQRIRRREYLPQLDALRAFAVLAVMIGHYAPAATESLPLGQLGVRLFFVLSGFLITGILLNCRQLVIGGAPGSGVLRRFYLRRFLRLIPPYYALLAIMWVASIPEVRDSMGWHAAYASNIYFWRIGAWHGETSHFWSLAVEEQFYLVWPLIVMFQPRRRTAVALALIALSAPLFRAVGMSQQWSGVTMTVLPFASTDSLALGALLALCESTSASSRDRFSAIGGWISPVAIGLTLLMVLRIDAGRAWRDTCVATCWSMVFVWLVNRAALGFGGVVGAVLENRALVYLGRISYGLYLFHAVSPRILQWLWKAAGTTTPYPPNALVGVGGPIAVTIVLAAVSWHIYEGPLNRLKQYLPYEPRQPLQESPVAGRSVGRQLDVLE
jgi:peptidoglycan/LPS O-acetylase OafA/YrhL